MGRPTNPNQPERPYVKFGPVWGPEPPDNLTSGRAGTRGRLAASPQAPLSTLGWFGARNPLKFDIGPGRHKGRPTNPNQPESPYVKFGPVWGPETPKI